MNGKTRRYRFFLLATMLAAIAGGTSADERNLDKNSLDSQCLSCHTIDKKTPETLKELWDRRGPDLSSAGIKYKSEWLTQWLQNPTRIRPAGMFYGRHLKQGEKSDEIETESLVKHPSLSGEEASRVADLLMTLKQNQNLVKTGDYKRGSISITMGEMMFDKFKGCLACHQIEPGYGGLSGPEVYTAAKRLQEDYLVSFMRNPQAWNPKTIMPNKNLKERDLQKLVHYLRALSRENFK